MIDGIFNKREIEENISIKEIEKIGEFVSQEKNTMIDIIKNYGMGILLILFFIIFIFSSSFAPNYFPYILILFIFYFFFYKIIGNKKNDIEFKKIKGVELCKFLNSKLEYSVTDTYKFDIDFFRRTFDDLKPTSIGEEITDSVYFSQKLFTLNGFNLGIFHRTGKNNTYTISNYILKIDFANIFFSQNEILILDKCMEKNGEDFNNMISVKNEEFNEYFRIFSNKFFDEQQILTSDLLNEIVNFKKDFKGIFSMIFSKKSMYIITTSFETNFDIKKGGNNLKKYLDFYGFLKHMLYFSYNISQVYGVEKNILKQKLNEEEILELIKTL